MGSVVGKHRAHRSAVAGIALLVMASTALVFPSLDGVAAAATRPSAPLVPSSGALLGAYVDPDNRWTDFQDATTEIDGFESEIGRTMDIDHHYMRWGWPLVWDFERWDVENGRIPMVTWEPWDPSLADIASGRYDDYIRSEARSVAAFGHKMFLRFGHEMNGNWYPWDGSHNGGGTRGPATYVAAWRHIHDIFVQENATNAVWVWCPTAWGVPNEPWNAWGNYYPGNQYVDWVGMDGYNWGTTQSWSKWQSLSSIFRTLYNDYASVKPIMIAETASAELGGNKARWIADAQSTMKTTFPAIAAFVWFHTDKETDWRVDSSSASLEAFRALAHDPYFDGGSASNSTGGSIGTSETWGPIRNVDATPQALVHRTRIAVKLAKAARVTVQVVRTRTGHVARHLRHKVPYREGRHLLPWRAKNDRLHRVRPGRYTVIVRAFRHGTTATRKTHLRVRHRRW